MRKSSRARRKATFQSAHTIVNQLTGFILSDYHLSTEVHSDGWGFLNPQSRRLDKVTLGKIPDGAVVYVNTQETELFATHYLPRITSDIVLISSQLWSPPPPTGSVVDTVLAHPGILAWFSPNLEDPGSPLHPFPAGVALRGITNITNAMSKHQSTPRSGDIYVPYSAVHPHLVGRVAQTRKQLQPFMAQPLRHQDYLEQLAKHRFVISPAGDKPDTYRHWECIAMGAVPVSQLPPSFSALFGDSIILVDDLVASVKGPFDQVNVEKNPKLVTTAHWREVVDTARRARS